MSTYSPELRIELIANGTQAGVWGTTTNRNLGTIIEQAIAGYEAITTTTQKYALTVEDAQVDQARNAVLAVNTTFVGAYEIYAPPSSKLYVVQNNSAYDVTFFNSTVEGNTTPRGVGVVVKAGNALVIFTNGTDFYSAGSAGASTNTPNTLVLRDSNGNFAANIISAVSFTGSLSGNASSASSLTTSNWTVIESGGFLYFRNSGVNKMRLDPSGNLIVTGNVTAFGTIT